MYFIVNTLTTSLIISILSNKIILKDGDRISITAKNSSKTLSQSLRNIYYTISGEDIHIIAATGSGTIAVNGAI